MLKLESDNTSTTEAAAPSTIRFSTSDFPEKDRLEICREQCRRMALKIDFEPATDAAFECAVAVRALPDVKLIASKMSAVRIKRIEASSASECEDFVFLLNQNSAAAVAARGREVTLDVGDAVLMNTAEVKTFDRRAYGGALALRVPRAVLTSVVSHVDDVIMHPVSRQVGILKLLGGYAISLLNEVKLPSAELQRTAVNHLHDLVALALGATHDAAGIAIGRGLPAARLRLAKAYIIENSSRRDLSVGVVAAHLGLTPRNLQRLFESDGTTFSEFLLAQRLSCAYTMLTQANWAQSPVGAIAYDAGFGDLSYFNRSFKRRYGATPREIRNTMLHGIERGVAGANPA
jgi:AraC-like DNA-binding protein